MFVSLSDLSSDNEDYQHIQRRLQYAEGRNHDLCAENASLKAVIKNLEDKVKELISSSAARVVHPDSHSAKADQADADIRTIAPEVLFP